MTEATRRARPVHLVGSVPLNSTEEVMTCCASILGDRVRRLPDGETGARSNWIVWQHGVMAATPGLEESGGAFRLKPGQVSPVTFGELGYAAAARSSYAVFRQLRERGVVAADQRFQVSLPTPLAVVARFVAFDSQGAVEPSYERALLSELDEIVAAVPPDELAIQWDVAIEFAILEGLRPAPFTPAHDGVVKRLARLAGAVPEPVQLGFHLCYGDSGHKHFKEPDDTALMVKVANDTLARSPRSVQWLHLPVPRGRNDDAYFAPLRDLRLPSDTELYLGLVHATDGLAGAGDRIAAAERAIPSFGIATECGFGRRDPATVPALLRLHVDA